MAFAKNQWMNKERGVAKIYILSLMNSSLNWIKTKSIFLNDHTHTHANPYREGWIDEVADIWAHPAAWITTLEWKLVISVGA